MLTGCHIGEGAVGVDRDLRDTDRYCCWANMVPREQYDRTSLGLVREHLVWTITA